MKILKTIYIKIWSLVVLGLFIPGGIISAQTSGETGGSTSGGSYTGLIPACEGVNCDFNDIISTIDYLVDFATGIALVFSSAVIAFAGWKYMSSGDNPGKRKEANNMLQKVVIGIVLIMLAWVIVNLILTALGAKDTIRFSI